MERLAISLNKFLYKCTIEMKSINVDSHYDLILYLKGLSIIRMRIYIVGHPRRIWSQVCFVIQPRKKRTVDKRKRGSLSVYINDARMYDLSTID
jgi:hypothetical protein